MKWLLITVMIIIFLLFIPIRIKVKIHYDFLQSHGFASGYFFNIRLFLFGLRLMPNKIQLEGKKKNYVFPIIDFGNKKTFGEDYFGFLIKLLRLTHIRALSRIGIEDNCMLSCLTCGMLNVVFGSVACVALGDSETPFEINNFPNFLYKSALYGISSSVDITIFKMLLALIQTFSKKIRSVKNGNKQTY
ncbi:MAG: hypothetical protein ACI4L7_03995 [Christensenellales bacterium]